jgi:flagellar basal body-associated protein FliL
VPLWLAILLGVAVFVSAAGGYAILYWLFRHAARAEERSLRR